MVDKHEILDNLKLLFHHTGIVSINDDGLISIRGNCTSRFPVKSKIENFPIHFYKTGEFICAYESLISLIGSPKIVNGSFDCSYTLINSLEGGPQYVNGSYYCNNNINLVSLKGVPKSIDGHFAITVYKDTPLLKILDIKGINLFKFYKPSTNGYDSNLTDVFNNYYGKKNAIMKVGLEMIRIGYGSNARL